MKDTWFNVRSTKKMKKQLKGLADSREDSVASIVRFIIENFFEKQKK